MKKNASSRQVIRRGDLSELIRKRREKRKAEQEIWGDVPSDPDGLLTNFDLAVGFDVDCSSRPYTLVMSQWGYDYYTGLQCRLGLYCYNFQKGTNFKFERWEKFSTDCSASVNFYLTFEAMDPASHSVFSFQMLFSDFGCGPDVNIDWKILACRIKCNESVDDYWDVKNAIDPFYKDDMPSRWFSDEALVSDPKKYYVVQQSELLENDWLYLLSEIDFSSKKTYGLTASPDLEIMNVVVQTNEDYTTEASEKLKAENAIFYIRYKCVNVGSATGLEGFHRAIVRKTMDGKPGHMSIEVASMSN